MQMVFSKDPSLPTPGLPPKLHIQLGRVQRAPTVSARDLSTHSVERVPDEQIHPARARSGGKPSFPDIARARTERLYIQLERVQSAPPVFSEGPFHTQLERVQRANASSSSEFRRQIAANGVQQ